MHRPDIRVLDDAGAVSRAAADMFAEAGREAVSRRGQFIAVLAGGSTPERTYRALAAEPLRSRVPWPSTVILFGDERAVGPDDERSNYRMAREALLDHVPIPPGRVHRMRGEIDLETAALEYERTLRSLYADAPAPRFDLVLLGMGADGHTASLFPGTAGLDERERWVVANDVPQLSARRVTLTFPALGGARHVVFVITGSSKAAAFAGAFAGAPHHPPYPAERIVPAQGRLTVLADRAAATPGRPPATGAGAA